MSNALVITHPEMGVYLGSFMGLGFWSNLDSAGQDSAVTFESEAKAIEYIRSWDELNDPADYRFAEVAPSDGIYATVADLKRAGLEAMLGEMKAPEPRTSSNEPSGPGL